MGIKEALEFVDVLVSAQAGKSLDDLERAIFRGAWEGQTYSEIARSYHCSDGHVKDMGARLWEVLSIALNTDIHKKNFRGAIEQAFEQQGACQFCGLKLESQ